MRSPFTLSTPGNGARNSLDRFAIANVGRCERGPALSILLCRATTYFPCSIVRWTNANNVTTNLPTTYVPAAAATSTSSGNPIELTATIPSADFLISGAGSQTASLTAFNVASCAPSQNSDLPDTSTVHGSRAAFARKCFGFNDFIGFNAVVQSIGSHSHRQRREFREWFRCELGD